MGKIFPRASADGVKKATAKRHLFVDRGTMLDGTANVNRPRPPPAVGGLPRAARGKADEGNSLSPWATLRAISRIELVKRKSWRNDDGTLAGESAENRRELFDVAGERHGLRPAVHPFHIEEQARCFRDTLAAFRGRRGLGSAGLGRGACFRVHWGAFKQEECQVK